MNASMRSNSAPLMRLRYLCTLAAEQWHCLRACPRYPQGQGFIAPTTVHAAGNVELPVRLDITTCLSSSGCLRASRASRENSGSSSRNKTPRWARLTSPGRSPAPPPTSATREAVWWGALNGRVFGRPVPPSLKPAALQTLATSRASSRVSGGKMLASLRASIVFPDPGAPTMSR